MFHALDSGTLARLAAASVRLPLPRGAYAFRRGDPPTGMYVVVYGQVRLLGCDRTGGERLAGVVHAGSSFGEAVMFLGRPALVDAQAATDTLLLRLPLEAVDGEIERNPLFARRLLAGLSARLEAFVQERARHDLGSGRERLLDYLRRLAGGTPAEPFALPATKRAIAAHLSVTPEHFSRLLRDLADEGRLRVEGRRITLLPAATAAPTPPGAG
nr:Crp/Fnr family transcriptional regulator [Ramlibacter cellulosilyticus]